MSQASTPRVIRLSGPLDIAASLEVLRRSGDDRIDRWDGMTLLRTVNVDGASSAFAAVPQGTSAEPALRVSVEKTCHRRAAERAAASTFAQAPAAFGDLLGRDSVITRLERLYPGVRPIRQHDLFAALVRAISAQQVNLRWAATTRKRLVEAFGYRHEIGGLEVYSLDAERLAATDPMEIRALQFTTRKAEYIVGIAKEIASGRLTLDELGAMDDDEVIRRLTALRGIGRWTAEWILVRTLGRPRVVAGDLGVRKAVGLAYLDEPFPSEQAVREATAHWGDSIEVAQGLVLHGLAEGAFNQASDGADRAH